MPKTEKYDVGCTDIYIYIHAHVHVYFHADACIVYLCVAGKTFSMCGPPNNYQLRGIIPRAITQVNVQCLMYTCIYMHFCACMYMYMYM